VRWWAYAMHFRAMVTRTRALAVSRQTCVRKRIPLLQGLPAWPRDCASSHLSPPANLVAMLLYFSARALVVLVWLAGSTMTGLPTVGGSLAGLSFLMARCTAFAALAVRADLELRRCGFVAMDCSNLRDCQANVARTGQVPEHIARRSLQAWVFEASASVFRRGRGADSLVAASASAGVSLLEQRKHRPEDRKILEAGGRSGRRVGTLLRRSL